MAVVPCSMVDRKHDLGLADEPSCPLFAIFANPLLA
jgi:hypothetical protein